MTKDDELTKLSFPGAYPTKEATATFKDVVGVSKCYANILLVQGVPLKGENHV